MLVVVTATIVHIVIIPTGEALQAGLGSSSRSTPSASASTGRRPLGLTALTAAIVAVLFIGRGALTPFRA